MTNGRLVKLIQDSERVQTISFADKYGKDIVTLVSDGSIYVHGVLIENDKELVDGFREFLKSHGFYGEEAE